MQARDIMRRDVVAVTETTPMAEVVRVLAEAQISAVPVVDDGRRLRGMAAAEDVIRAEAAGIRPSWRQVVAHPSLLRAHPGMVADVMSRDVVAVEETTPMKTLIRLLAKGPLKRLPVLRDGRLVGIISRLDVLRALSARL